MTREQIIEAMARAMCYAANGCCESLKVCVSCQRDAEAALDAALPLIAGVADKMAARADRVEVINAFGVEAAGQFVKSAEAIAEAIRALGKQP